MPEKKRPLECERDGIIFKMTTLVYVITCTDLARYSVMNKMKNKFRKKMENYLLTKKLMTNLTKFLKIESKQIKFLFFSLK